MFNYKTRDSLDATVPIRYHPATGAKTFKQGEPVVVTSGLLDNGAAAGTAFFGITNKAYTTATVAGALIECVAAEPDVIFEADYVGTSKTSVTNADLGTAFDLSATDNSKIGLDDVTDGAWVCVGYINATKKIYVKCLRSKASAIVA